MSMLEINAMLLLVSIYFFNFTYWTYSIICNHCSSPTLTDLPAVTDGILPGSKSTGLVLSAFAGLFLSGTFEVVFAGVLGGLVGDGVTDFLCLGFFLICFYVLHFCFSVSVSLSLSELKSVLDLCSDFFFT